ncbi:MAG: hypothetical protein KDD42_04525 [Bdellovibrionales bacterium]|nr:hypothetical protein [Bdellovibrionales bacterium]
MEGAVDRFVVITTTSEQVLANKTCQAIEDAGIPVMLDHRQIGSGQRFASGFRVLVPSQHSQTAQRLAQATSSAYYVTSATSAI